MKKIGILALILLISLNGIQAKAETKDVKEIIFYGETLGNKEIQKIDKIFNVKNKDNVQVNKITHSDEKKMLSKYIENKVYGEKSTSSVYIKKLKDGKENEVRVVNLTYINDELVLNILDTLQIKGVSIVAASNTRVSGTSALVGILSSKEILFNEKISNKLLNAAVYEVKITNNINSDKITLIIKQVKDKLDITKDITNTELTNLINGVIKKNNVKIKNADLNKISKLMKLILNANGKEVITETGEIAEEVINAIEELKDYSELKDILKEIAETSKSKAKEFTK